MQKLTRRLTDGLINAVGSLLTRGPMAQERALATMVASACQDAAYARRNAAIRDVLVEYDEAWASLLGRARVAGRVKRSAFRDYVEWYRPDLAKAVELAGAGR